MTEDSAKPARICVIIPAFNEERHIGNVVTDVRRHLGDVIVVDDGSTDRTAEIARVAGAIVIRKQPNAGKGAALNTGFDHARTHGYEALITMDADGQHLPDEIPNFVEAYNRTHIPVLLGNRMADTAAMPRVRRLTNQVMSGLLSRVMGIYIPDTQCGFRLYRCDALPVINITSGRFAAESEILLNFARRAIRVDSVRVSTVYADEQSKINAVTDTIRFLAMLLHHYRAAHRNRRFRTPPDAD